MHGATLRTSLCSSLTRDCASIPETHGVGGGLEVEEGGGDVERKGVSKLNDLCMLNKVWIHDAR